jgi:hypothetical protein
VELNINDKPKKWAKYTSTPCGAAAAWSRLVCWREKLMTTPQLVHSSDLWEWNGVAFVPCIPAIPWPFSGSTTSEMCLLTNNNQLFALSSLMLYRYNVADNQWISCAISSLSKRHASAVASTNAGSIVVCGGLRDTITVNSCDRYEIEEDKWIVMANMQECRAEALAACLDGSVYVFGGIDYTHAHWNGDRLHSAEKYDAQANRWSFIQPLPSTNDFSHLVMDCQADWTVS